MARRGPKLKTTHAAASRPPRDARWDPPPHLNEGAQAAWRHVVALLAEVGNLGRTDPMLVEVYAVNVAMLREAEASIAGEGVMLARDGGLVTNPACAVVNSATLRIKAIVNDLGLCPATSKYGTDKVGGRPAEGKWGGLLDVVG